MVALEADGSALRPPHPTLPPYTPHKTMPYHRLLKFNTRRPRLPPQRPMPQPSSKSRVDQYGSTPPPPTIPPSTLSSPFPMHLSPPPSPRHDISVNSTPDTTAHHADQSNSLLNTCHPSAAPPKRSSTTITHVQLLDQHIPLRSNMPPPSAKIRSTATQPLPTTTRIHTTASNETTTK